MRELGLFLGLGWLLSRRKRKRLPGPLDAALIAAIKAGDLEEVRCCLDQGANPNARDEEGDPVIFLVTSAPIVYMVHATRTSGGYYGLIKYKNHRQIATLLIERGASVKVKLPSGDTPLYQAMRSEETELIALIKERLR